MVSSLEAIFRTNSERVGFRVQQTYLNPERECEQAKTQ